MFSFFFFFHIFRISKNKRELLEAQSDDKPQINRRTSVMGQGQKQVVYVF